MTITRRALAGASLGAIAAPRIAHAAWPADRAIEVVVPFPPGGGVDIMTRAFLPYLQARLPGARFVVNNRGGAGGQVGAEAIANAAPDGYTIGASSMPGFVSIPIERATRYQPAAMTLLANVVDDPCAIAVRANSPIRTLADFIAAARARPETVTFATTGIGSDDHLAMLAFEGLTNTQVVHVPFTGMPQLLPQVLSGTVDVAALNVSEALQPVRDGQLRCIAQAGATRWAQMPDVPTYREQGVDLVASASRGLSAPGGLPAPIREQLEAACRAALEDPAFIADAERLGMPLRPIIGAEYRSFVLDIEARYRVLWQQKPWRDR
ncbi:tripartite tricarboxylate transporter substrate binding protein [Rhodovarius crocodyli]|uniref:Tripartite tricarboxylate transporter substrate binding protein n=1 Tax=Rhodovarius crocodyli TaxID=1979269 RepID=A0A437M1T6_9PROT|nr:tripartite tricarboxylate transporter substrate binding protein [Rhodovarius crocodyli]RVT91572.1 tripartite tricarboxylate transporter substrate binding protein [Rhodovarius crocodyli]